MPAFDAATARDFLEATVAGFSVLGGFMAYMSGFRAAQALVLGQSPEVLAHQVNLGIARGFLSGSPLAVFALIIMVWT
jgi:hypothetical protein